MLLGVEQPKATAAAFSPVVVTPTYNNARTVIDVLTRVRATGLPLIVVNDGSTDATAGLLAEFVRQNCRDVTVVTHERNRGKAAALKTGFAAAAKAGFTHAVTIDTDGQLDPEQIPELLAAARDNPGALVVGCRDDGKADYPARSRLGRRISNAAIRWESGVRIGDSQCGFRVYPVGFVRTTCCRAPYFAFEAEIITRAGWAGRPVVEVPVNCRYLPPGQRVSHFKPVKDTLRGIATHLRLLATAVLRIPPKWALRS